MTVAEVKRFRGAPTLFINGVPQPAIVFWGPAGEGQPQYYDGIDFVVNLAKAGTGVHIYSFPTDLGWTGPNQHDYSIIDRNMGKVVEADPEGFIIPRVDCNSPVWWDKLHPGELTIYDDGEVDKNAKASYASDLWRAEVGEALERCIRHVMGSGYGEHVIAYHVCVGYTGEWNRYRAQDGYSWDYSRPMAEWFRKWLESRYGDVSKLRTAWKDEAVDFSNASVPSRAEELKTDLYTFRDPSVGRHVVDYYLSLSDLVADDINYLCKIAKDASANNSLTGVFYGYIMETWPGAFFSNEGFSRQESYEMNQQQRWGHQALMKVLDSPYVDFICSPNSYLYRCVGGEASFFSATETIMLHGKLWFSEDDTRTFMASDVERGLYGKCETLEETVSVLKRNFCNVLTRGVGMWWMNLGASEWFNHPELLKCLSEMKRIADADMSLDRSCKGEVAVIVDETSPCYQGVSAHLMYPLITKWKQYELGRMGAPYAVYMHDDLAGEDMPDYRFYIFLNTFYLSKVEREVIKDKVQRDGKVVLWVYAPGLIDDNGVSAENMYDLTGIRLAYDADRWGLNVSVTNFDHPITADLPSNTCFGTDNLIGPIIYCDDTDAVTLGKLIYNRGRFKPGLTVKSFEDWTSIYAGAPMIPASILRNMAKFAGVHVYCEDLDVLYANEHFLAIHTNRSGRRNINLPKRTDVYDVFKKRDVAEKVKAFTDYIQAYDTVLYFIGGKKDNLII